MSIKQVQTEANHNRRSISRNHNVFRTNSIRGVSLNYSMNNSQPTNNSNSQNTHNNAKPNIKTLTVFVYSFSIMWGREIMMV